MMRKLCAAPGEYSLGQKPSQLDHPIISGQCAQVLDLLRSKGSVLSFELTAEWAIPEAAARIHDLRAMGFNVITTIEPEIRFRGQIRRRVARYSLGAPEWRGLSWSQPMQGDLFDEQTA